MTMMIDYLDEDEKIVRKTVDDCEFSVRDGEVRFTSNGKDLACYLDQVFQVYMTK